MVLVVMGVSGCGKTSVGEGIAKHLGCNFYDGDNFHPPANRAKLTAGIPLNDDDRKPWLETLADMINQHVQRKENAVFACSALKSRYREILGLGRSGIQFVYLKGSLDLIRPRLNSRKGHFMNPALLESQFSTLEEPTPSEAWHVDIAVPVDQIINEITTRIA